MPVDIDSPEGHLIRKMVPFSTMPNNIFKVICNKLIVENARSGTFLFKRGDTKNDLVYLLKGEISLEVDKLKMEIIKAGTESARFAIAHQLPRKTHAVAKGTVRFARLNIVYINPPDPKELAKQQEKTKELQVLEESTDSTGTPTKKGGELIRKASKENAHDWVATLLMVPVIRSLPPASMHKIAEVLEEVRYYKNETIIQQGDEGDYYYLIKEGECLVTHKNSEKSTDAKVGKLQGWDTFGETALISGEPRSNTIIALNTTSLLRIDKENFLKLVKEPALERIDFMEMDMLLAQGGILLDVRAPDEYDVFHLEYAINAPLHGLHTFLKTLDKDKTLLVCCLDGVLSEIAAFLLITHKFSVKILRGGIKKVPKDVLRRAQQITGSNQVHEDVVFGNSDVKTPEEQVETLSTENAQLRKMFKELKQKYEKTAQDKADLETKYKQLFKQAERLQALLESAKKQ